MRKNNKRGFTMAEMLIVVAIIGVLAGVSFIAVQNHQRSMAQLERDTIAKEIYFAAQNHLTMAESQGYLTGTAVSVDSTFFGTEETSTQSKTAGVTSNANNGKIYYAVVNGGTSFASTAILDLMLPFGSIDETVRAGGSYIIRYQANPAIVLDVFYCSRTGKPDKFNHTIEESEYSTFLGYRNNVPGNGYVVGWYGGAGVGEAGSYLKTPSVEVTNAEKLTVKVTDFNKGDADASIKLIVSGVSSEAKAAFILNTTNRDERVTENTTGVPIDRSEYVITLDDITLQNTVGRGWHFADLNNVLLHSQFVDVTGTFKPGENIVVVAVSYSNSSLTNIAYSNEITTNSLYADLIEVAEETTTDEEGNVEITTPKSATAVVNNIRHLENLDNSLSGWNVDLTDAKQVADLDWSAFVTEIGEGTVSICKQGDITKGTKTDCYLPVCNMSALTYDGNNHKITNITVDTTGETSNTIVTINDGGVFGALTGAQIKNLALVDTNVTLASGNAGALAGTLTGGKVENVIAYNSTDATTDNVTTLAGNAGGLVGSMSAGTEVSKSAAALIVNATGGNAGGLVGSVGTGATCTVSDCYSGGHTIDDPKDTGAVVYDSSNYNVTAIATTSKDSTIGGYAGGLIGDAGTTEITNSYSTCSVSGMKAGGLVGKSSGAITNSYCTGLVGVTLDNNGKPVTGNSMGAFAAECTGTTTSCSYFEIINEFTDDTLGYDYLTPLPIVGTGDGSKTGISALDADASTYNSFTEVWSSAEPYLKSTLKKYYGEGTGDARVAKYNLKGMKRLNSAVTDADFVATHYGDWPVPEIFVVNTKDTSTTP